MFSPEKSGYSFAMNTHPRRPKKKPGPVKRRIPMTDTHIFLPTDLLEWAKYQDEGLAGLVRALLARERQTRLAPPGS